jgi:predicted nuclease of predicted toxin-antitoxin system
VKFLADAHISVDTVTMIRGLGHDCLDASVIPPRMLDIDVLKMAAADERVVVTADKDFGELVFVHDIPCPGVILIRLPMAHEAD